MTWKHPSSPVTKKFKVQRSAAKVMATVFWGAKGVILLGIFPQGQCINAARYCSTLERLSDVTRRKRPGLLRRGVVLQHDNATPHFHLLGSLKRHLGGITFETEGDLVVKLKNWLAHLDLDFFRVGIYSLLSR
ncbi:histone-lysine N-methyltransferase SETMAR [Elysia marginata]|uniref:Histone-lysine N-methyltransferase SETMAR n=1 Tax=Elysia marginata TaxID=1093978 RepID=A0AAV4HAT9_9GAST|nr:histone-lysine N-methyltransferase SETMAR [Elysia marginata]